MVAMGEVAAAGGDEESSPPQPISATGSATVNAAIASTTRRKSQLPPRIVVSLSNHITVPLTGCIVRSLKAGNQIVLSQHERCGSLV